MTENLLDPLFLFFAVGFLAGILKSDLHLPDAIYQLLSTYLLLAIGLKGGVQLASAPLGHVAIPAMGTVALGLFQCIAYFLVALRIGKLARADAASLAAHYGSVSAVTFAAAAAMLQRDGVSYEGYLPVLLVLLEVPAILAAIFLHRIGAPADSPKLSRHKRAAGYGAIVHEILLNRSVFLLLAGMAVGYLAGPVRFEPFKLLFADAFRPILAFFILEMGLVAATRLSDIRKAGVFLAAFGTIAPIFGGALGVWVASLCGMSVGGCTLFGAMTASASYIAAPAAIRAAIPEANTGMSIAASIGVTFPLNLAFGIPLYQMIAQRIVGAS